MGSWSLVLPTWRSGWEKMHEPLHNEHQASEEETSSSGLQICSVLQSLLTYGSGAAAPETTLHCSTSKSNLLSQWASRLGQHAQRDTCEATQTGWGELPPRSRWLGLPPLALSVIARWFFVAFQKRILKSGAALQSKPSVPGDRPGNPPLPVAPDEGGRRIDFCFLSCLPFPAGGSDKHGCSPLCCHIFGTSTLQGLSCNMALQV